MKMDMCHYCSSSLKPGNTTVNGHDKDGEPVIIEDVPVMTCTRCGENYFDSRDLKKIEDMIEKQDSIERFVRVPVMKFKVA